MKNVVPLLFSFFLCGNFFAQTTIWSENFNSYTDGTTVGANNNTANAAADWTSGGCPSCPANTTDWWEIRSGLMEARDVNDDHVFLLTEIIDISAFPAVYFQVDCNEQGDHEGLYQGTDDCVDALNQDYADIEYSINGGAWTLVQNHLGWCGLYASCGTHTFYGDDGSSGDCRTTDDDWEDQTVQVLGLSGTTIQLRLSCTNSAGSEYIGFDNITVVGYDPLPIELTFFEAKQNGGAVELMWQTVNELNNESFSIERTKDGSTWEQIHQESGAGNSNFELNYSTIDQRPLVGVSYYRLKQVDFDGKFSYSDIKSVRYSSTEMNISMFPNPANNKVRFSGEQLLGSEIVIRDEFGKLCQYQSGIETSETTLDLSELKNGVYHVQLANNNQTITKKLVVLH